MKPAVTKFCSKVQGTLQGVVRVDQKVSYQWFIFPFYSIFLFLVASNKFNSRDRWLPGMFMLVDLNVSECCSSLNSVFKMFAYEARPGAYPKTRSEVILVSEMPRKYFLPPPPTPHAWEAA